MIYIYIYYIDIDILYIYCIYIYISISDHISHRGPELMNPFFATGENFSFDPPRKIQGVDGRWPRSWGRCFPTLWVLANRPLERVKMFEDFFGHLMRPKMVAFKKGKTWKNTKLKFLVVFPVRTNHLFEHVGCRVLVKNHGFRVVK